MENKPQSERAHELAGFVRGFYGKNYYAFTDYLLTRYGDRAYGDTCNHLADEIESLGEQDGLPYPLDKDGIPIKLGETVYSDDGQYQVTEIQYHDFGFDNIHITVMPKKEEEDSTLFYMYSPKYLSHSKPRTLDDIKDDIHTLISGLIWRVEQLDKYVQEAYDLGMSDGANKNE